MKFKIVISQYKLDVWEVECPAIPACVSTGKTREEAIANIKEAIELCLEARAQKGLPMTSETQEIEISLNATDHEFSSIANIIRLDASIEQHRLGKGFQKELIEI